MKGETEMKWKASPAVVLLLLLFPVSLWSNSQSFDEAKLSQKGREAYRTLLVAKWFENKTVGYSGDPSKLVEAYNILLKEKSGDAAFKALLNKATTAGQLYALCGLYITDLSFFHSSVQRFRQSQENVYIVSDDIGGGRPISALIEADKPIVIDYNRPKESLQEYFELNRKMVSEWDDRWKKKQDARPTAVYELDILHGGYSIWFADNR